MNEKYILNDKLEAVLYDNLETWAKMLENNRHIAKTEINDLLISTVFLGIDHSFGKGPPLLFETMVFRPPSWMDLDCERCSTYKQAEAMHKRMVEKYSK